jgi:uncharacterized protein (TIGR03382 family)
MMSISQQGEFAMKTRMVRRFLLAPFAVLAVCGTFSLVRAQENKAADRPRSHDADARGHASLVVAGYTRPGNPSDKAPGGKIVPGGYLAGNPDFNGLGGTVFFAVYRLSSGEGDMWGTGVKDFDKTFVPGVDYNDAGSPSLDTRAKYLYLYQVVNSRGLDPISPGMFAANTQKGTEPIASTAVRLRVDPRYITSWGHFKNTGLTLAVMPEHLQEKKEGIAPAAGEKKSDAARPAIEDDKEGALRMAVSVNPSILGSLDMNAYLWGAPAHRLDRIRVNSATLNLADSPALKDLAKRVEGMKKNNERPAAWAEEMLKATKRATPPALVRLVLSEPDARLFLQADWMPSGDGLLNLADHSTVFGFTTDLPPVPEPVGIASPDGRAALLAILGKFAGDGPVASVMPAVDGVAPAVGQARMQETLPAAGPALAGALAALLPGSDSAEPVVAEEMEADVTPAVASGVALGVAPGMAIGPIQPAGFAPAAAGAPAGLGNALPAIGGFGAGVPFANWGGIGTAPAPFFGAGTTGNGNGNGGFVTSPGSQGNVTVNTGPVNVTTNAVNQTQTTSVDTNISLQNQQSQSQSQSQTQSQSQNQNQSQCTSSHHHVVPEPGAIVLALLGLPVLVVLYRRRRRGMATCLARV